MCNVKEYICIELHVLSYVCNVKDYICIELYVLSYAINTKETMVLNSLHGSAQ